MVSTTVSPSTSSSGDVDTLAASYIEQILNLEEIDVGLYRGTTPFTGMNQRSVYGGQLVAQALSAAGRTISDDFRIHSLHSYFVRPSDNERPLLYRVDQVRQGTNFAVRHVRVSQGGKATFYLTASFQRRGMGGLSHQEAMPSAPEPLEVPSDAERYLQLSQDARLPQAMRSVLEDASKMPFPVDLRRVNAVNMFFPEKRDPHQLMWMKTRGMLSDSPIVHQCMAAYGSDAATVPTLLLPHSVGFVDKRLKRATSLDHSMWFHEEDFRADDWLLYSLRSPVTSCSRGLVLGHIYDKNGRLVISVAQEGFISFVEDSKAASKL